jgi:hypothetical protein
VACRQKELGEKEKRTATNPPTVTTVNFETSRHMFYCRHKDSTEIPPKKRNDSASDRAEFVNRCFSVKEAGGS